MFRQYEPQFLNRSLSRRHLHRRISIIETQKLTRCGWVDPVAIPERRRICHPNSVMDWSLQQIVEELVARITSGPMQFRLIVQPSMALVLGIRDGLSDAKAG